MNSSRRPAPGDPDFPYMMENTPEEFDRVIGRTPPPVTDPVRDEMRDKLAAALALAYSGRTEEAFDAAPVEWRQAWFDDTEALLPTVRQIVAAELRAAAADREMPMNRVRDWLRDRANALDPQ